MLDKRSQKGRHCGLVTIGAIQGQVRTHFHLIFFDPISIPLGDWYQLFDKTQPELHSRTLWSGKDMCHGQNEALTMEIQAKGRLDHMQTMFLVFLGKKRGKKERGPGKENSPNPLLARSNQQVALFTSGRRVGHQPFLQLKAVRPRARAGWVFGAEGIGSRAAGYLLGFLVDVKGNPPFDNKTAFLTKKCHGESPFLLAHVFFHDPCQDLPWMGGGKGC